MKLSSHHHHQAGLVHCYTVATSVFSVTFWSWLKIGKESRFCKDRLDLAFGSLKDTLRVKSTGFNLSTTGDCEMIWHTQINLVWHTRMLWHVNPTEQLKSYQHIQFQMMAVRFGRQQTQGSSEGVVQIILKTNSRASFSPGVCLHCVVHRFRMQKHIQVLQKLQCVKH